MKIQHFQSTWTAGPRAAVGPRPRTRVLLADERRILRKGARDVLEASDECEVVGEATDGEQAVALAERLNPDVVLIDPMLPLRSGVEVIRSIQSVARCIVMGIREGAWQVDDVLRAGALGYVDERTSPAELIEAILSVAAGQPYVSPAVSQLVAEGVIRSRRPVDSPLYRLTRREREVLGMIAQGLTNREVAGQLSISPKTVDGHRANLMDKLDLHKTAGLVRFAIREGLLSP